MGISGAVWEARGAGRLWGVWSRPCWPWVLSFPVSLPRVCRPILGSTLGSGAGAVLLPPLGLLIGLVLLRGLFVAMDADAVPRRSPWCNARPAGRLGSHLLEGPGRGPGGVKSGGRCHRGRCWAARWATARTRRSGPSSCDLYGRGAWPACGW
jgi:hypothetical protein